MNHSRTERVSLFNALLDRWRVLFERMRDPYRPERHYMRGPASGWRPAKPADPARPPDKARE